MDVLGLINIVDYNGKMRPELVQMVNNEFKEERYKKGELVWREGKVVSKLYVVKEGLMRTYYYNKEGKEITHWFAMEATVITDMGSFFKRTPTEYNMEALEDMVVYTITLDKLNRLFDFHHEIERFGRLISMEIMLQITEKVKDLQFRTAVERYNILLDKHPSIIQRAPLGKIASYLGITQQSLSRIRAQY